jgi:hypothetical protein
MVCVVFGLEILALDREVRGTENPPATSGCTVIRLIERFLFFLKPILLFSGCNF